MNHNDNKHCQDVDLASTIATVVTELQRLQNSVQSIENLLYTMMNDAPRLAKTRAAESTNPLKQRAIALSSEVDWLFKRSGNGGYDFKTANESAYRFLSEVKKRPNAQAYLDRFLTWTEVHCKSWQGSLRVTATMFEFLHSCFEQHEAQKTANSA